MRNRSVTLLVPDEGKEHVESNLDRVDEDQAMLVGDELEVHSVNDRPDLPRSLAGGKKIVPDFRSDGAEGVSIDQSKIGEEDSHKAWAKNRQDKVPNKVIKVRINSLRKISIQENCTYHQRS